MNLLNKIEIGILVLILALSVALGVGYVREREARIHAEATQSATDRVVQKQDELIRYRDQAAAQNAAALAAQAAQLHTPQQAAQVILRYLPAPVAPAAAPGVTPPAPTPIPVVERAALPEALQARLPDSPTYGILTGPQLVQQAKQDLACAADQVNLAACEADRAALREELAAEKQASATWQRAAKGGSKFHRIVKLLEVTACAGGGAWLGAQATPAHPQNGAAIGAGAAAATCTIF